MSNETLTESQIRAGWEATFSTNNPFCPCDLKSFTKAARWAERAVLAKAAAPVVPPEWSKAVQEAYGWLWHVNNEPMAPVPMWSPEQAAYEARRNLRELLTSGERGEAINAVAGLLQNKVLAASPPAPPSLSAGPDNNGSAPMELLSGAPLAPQAVPSSDLQGVSPAAPGPGSTLQAALYASIPDAEPRQEADFFWMVAEFDLGEPTGRYMLDQGDLSITEDVFAARRFIHSRTAMFRAEDMREKHGGDWRYVQRGFPPAARGIDSGEAGQTPQAAGPEGQEPGRLQPTRPTEVVGATTEKPGEREALRQAQARAVMPLIGPLLDAWDGLPNDVKLDDELSEVRRHITSISRGMDAEGTLPASPAPDAVQPEPAVTPEQWRLLADAYDALMASQGRREAREARLGMQAPAPDAQEVKRLAETLARMEFAAGACAPDGPDEIRANERVAEARQRLYAAIDRLAARGESEGSPK